MPLISECFPDKIENSIFHRKLLNRLKHMSKDESIPHIIFCGPSGSGKKTIVRMFLEMLFDKDIHKQDDSPYNITAGGGKVSEITIKQSNYHIVIEPSNTNFDKYVIQGVVGEYAKKMQLNVFNTKKSFKIVLINNTDNLSYYAQTSLRRTMEKYSDTCRFIMWCSNSTKIIEPLLSRCIYISISAPSDEEMFSYILRLSLGNGIKVTSDDMTYFLKNSNGNIKTARWLLEFHKYGYTHNNKNMYTCAINAIVSIIISHNLNQINVTLKKDRCENYTKLYIRNLLYNIMITNFTGINIMQDIVRSLCVNKDIPDGCKIDIVEQAAYFENSMLTGRRVIFSLEALIIKIMEILYDYEVAHPEYNAVFGKYLLTESSEITNSPAKKNRAKPV